MPRTKMFDEREVLEKMLPLFRDKGFHRASLDDILRTGGIGRQSLYNTFGDKKRLFLKVLSLFRERVMVETEARLERDLGSGTPTPDILRWLLYAEEPELGIGAGLLASTMVEFSDGDPEVGDEIELLLAYLRKTLMKLVRLGQERGEVAGDLSMEKIVEVLLNAGIGLHIAKVHNLPSALLYDTARWTVALILPR